VSRVVIVLVRVYRGVHHRRPAHQSLATFETAMEQNDPAIAPSMLYAYALSWKACRSPTAPPNLTVDVPALQHLAEERKISELAARTSRPARR